MLAKHFRAWLESILSVQGFFGYHRETRFLERIAQLAESLRRARRPISRELSPQGKNGKYDEHASEADCREAAGTMRISIPRALKECFSETCHLVHISPGGSIFWDVHFKRLTRALRRTFPEHFAAHTFSFLTIITRS